MTFVSKNNKSSGNSPIQHIRDVQSQPKYSDYGKKKDKFLYMENGIIREHNANGSMHLRPKRSKIATLREEIAQTYESASDSIKKRYSIEIDKNAYKYAQVIQEKIKQINAEFVNSLKGLILGFFGITHIIPELDMDLINTVNNNNTVRKVDK